MKLSQPLKRVLNPKSKKPSNRKKNLHPSKLHLLLAKVQPPPVLLSRISSKVLQFKA